MRNWPHTPFDRPFVWRASGASFNPASLFASGEEGAWYEPGPSTAFQDTAGATPAGLGDPVGRLNDLSGNGNHLTQATASSKPTLQQTAGGLWYLQFDGVDDFLELTGLTWLVTAQATFVGTQGGANPARIYSQSDAGADYNTSDHYIPVIRYPGGGGLSSFIWGQYREQLVSAPANTVVFASHHNGSLLVNRANGVASPGYADTISKTFTAARIGKAVNDNSGLLDGRIYTLIVRNAACTAAQIADTEAYVAEHCGVTL